MWDQGLTGAGEMARVKMGRCWGQAWVGSAAQTGSRRRGGRGWGKA